MSSKMRRRSSLASLSTLDMLKRERKKVRFGVRLESRYWLSDRRNTPAQLLHLVIPDQDSRYSTTVNHPLKFPWGFLAAGFQSPTARLLQPQSAQSLGVARHGPQHREELESLTLVAPREVETDLRLELHSIERERVRQP